MAFSLMGDHKFWNMIYYLMRECARMSRGGGGGGGGGGEYCSNFNELSSIKYVFLLSHKY